MGGLLANEALGAAELTDVDGPPPPPQPTTAQTRTSANIQRDTTHNVSVLILRVTRLIFLSSGEKPRTRANTSGGRGTPSARIHV